MIGAALTLLHRAAGLADQQRLASAKRDQASTATRITAAMPTAHRPGRRDHATSRVSPGVARISRAPPGSSGRIRCSGRCAFERCGHRRFDLGTRHRRACASRSISTVAAIDEARRAVAALEAEMVEEGLLHRREREDLALVVAPGDALDGADALAVEEAGAGDAGPHLLAGAIVADPRSPCRHGTSPCRSRSVSR